MVNSTIPKNSKERCKFILEEAFSAATYAAEKELYTNGERPYDFNCGFAWVTIKPARGNLCSVLKQDYGCSKGYYGGLEVWMPGRINSQNMYVHLAGAKAFAEVLRSYGYNAEEYSRLD